MQIASVLKRKLKEIQVNLDNARAALEEVSDDLRHEDMWQDCYHLTHATLLEEIDYELLVALFNIDQSLKNFTGDET